jgi:deazaflavin-dependent oxidoreductase (nitroreductase family)
VQVKGDRFHARAHPAGPDEKPRLWETMTTVFPDYAVYQTRTDRQIPVVILERSEV